VMQKRNVEDVTARTTRMLFPEVDYENEDDEDTTSTKPTSTKPTRMTSKTEEHKESLRHLRVSFYVTQFYLHKNLRSITALHLCKAAIKQEWRIIRFY